MSDQVGNQNVGFLTSRLKFNTVHYVNTAMHYALIVKARVFYFLFHRFFSQQVRVGGRNKNKNKNHSDHFPIELKLNETRNRVSFNLNSI